MRARFRRPANLLQQLNIQSAGLAGASGDPPGGPSGAGAGSVAGGGRLLLVDAHVHVPPEAAWGDVLDRAAANLSSAGRALDLPGDCGAWGGLLLAARGGRDPYRRLARAAARGSPAPAASPAPGGSTGACGSTGSWSLARSPGDVGIVARRADRRILVAPGRQVRTAEGLELLALLGRGEVPGGAALGEAVAAATADGGVAVIPWAFGKWWRRRGRVLRELLEGPRIPGLLLADSALRPWPAPEPTPFRWAARRGIPVLAGTDPLPFAGEVERVGTYGSLLRLPLDGERPAASVAGHLRGLVRSPPTFGARLGWGRFLYAQARLRL